jgi:hypothetical protein
MEEHNQPEETPCRIHFEHPRKGKPGGGWLSSAPDMARLWFDPVSFRRVGSGPSVADGAGRFGNFGRNVFHGPGIANWDFAAFKRIKTGEKGRLEFRTEFLNIFNHAQFLNPEGRITNNANFGRVTGTRDPRVVQLTLRYAF